MVVWRQMSQYRLVMVAVSCCLAMLLFGEAWAKQEKSGVAVMPKVPEIAARAFVLIDMSAGKQVLASRELDIPIEPAALTKLMTAYIVFDALRSQKMKLDSVLAVSEKAWKMSGARMFIEPSMKVRVEDLLKGMIVQSANDAAIALAEGVAGSEEAFVQRMNDTARLLGMGSTSYRNAAGLTAPHHITTARDTAVLATRLLEDFPQYIPYYGIRQWHYPGTPTFYQNNNNLLLFKDPHVDGLLTAHTRAAGYSIVATANRIMPNMSQGRRLLAVVFGTASEAARVNETQKLLNWGYGAFESLVLFPANATVRSVRVWRGDKQQVGLGSQTPIAVAIPNGQAQSIVLHVQRPSPLLAPLQIKQPVGLLHIQLNGQSISTQPLVALDTVNRGSFLRRLWDAIAWWFRGVDTPA